MSRILLVEDKTDLARDSREHLEAEGHEVEVAEDASAAIECARRWSPELVILDLTLPDTDGFRVLKTLRGAAFEGPILVLAVRGEEAARVRALRLGADDHVTRPFGPLELLARVEALLRRAEPAGDRSPAVERFGDVEVRRPAREVFRAGKAVELTPREYDLLVALLDRRGAVASRPELMREVWGYSDVVETRAVDAHIAGLRRKLEERPAAPVHILTVGKVGYRLRRPD